jgi:hypothetical protein
VTPEDENRVAALVHHANVIFTSDGPQNAGRENDLADIKRALQLAEQILSGHASEAERQSAGELVHPQVRSLYGL